METFFAEHAFGASIILLLLGGIVSLFFKSVWEHLIARSSRVTPDRCLANQQMCGTRVVKEIQDFRDGVNKLLGVNENKLEAGEDAITAIRLKVIRLNSLVETSIELQLEFCRTVEGMVCDSYLKRLIKLGLEFDKLDNEDEVKKKP